MNILITGIHGFVGTNLVQSLKSNHIIYGLDIVAPSKDGVVKTYSWNDLGELPAIDAVIHLAGKAHDTKNQTNAQVYFDINTGLTQKIYDWFRSSSASKFIFFSSVKAAADKVEGILTEEIDPTPLGPYGESKIAAESYILSLQSAVCSEELRDSSLQFAVCSEEFRDNSLQSAVCSDKKLVLQTIDCKLQTESPKLQTKNFFILRPCMIHGPGNKGNLNLLYNVVKKGIPYPLGAFENRRSFCSIDNLIFVLQGILEKDVESGIYNVCDDEKVSTNELIELISSSVGKKSRIWRISTPLIELIAKVGTILHLPLNTERLQKLTENYVVSNAKIKKALGVDKMPVRSTTGLVKTVKSFNK